MKRFVLGLGVGLSFGLVSVYVVLQFFLQLPVSLAGTTTDPVVVLENDQVRVLSLTLEPGQATPVHTHQLDEIVICLEGGKLRITVPNGDAEGTVAQPKFGDVFMPKVKGVTHVLANAGTTRYRQISIELKEQL